ncbi:CDGSH iron-sulfur domain-containing protein [Arthrobacter sp. Br18]|uniref:CDGSH iron-sulfur domain-containing protein n=1 Tax=Arthrobacter sp. Br18 TaxID=1312954 RepID=UPI0004798BA6|nr:CDGSH iron-sulfur domain-containing protein [Arthrobacter sp. Br18]
MSGIPVEAGAHADDAAPSPKEAAASIVAFPDGPLLVRGDFELVDPEGAALPRRRRTIALCRCGASALKPYCDGTHKLIGFKAAP